MLEQGDARGLLENAEARMHDYRTKLEVIDRAISEEKSKNYSDRRIRLLWFLHSEKTAYSLALTELSAVFQDLRAPRAEDEPSKYDVKREVGREEDREIKKEKAAESKRIYRILTWGGIGDVLLMTPAFRALKQRDSDCRIYVYCVAKPHIEALKENRYIDHLRLISAWEKILYNFITRFGMAASHKRRKTGPLYKRLMSLKGQVLDYGNLKPSLFYSKNAAEIIGEMLGVEIDDPRPNCFLTDGEEMEGRKIVSKYANPVAIQVYGKGSSNKNWEIEKWEKLILSNPHYNFLQLGMPNEELVKGAEDFRGTTLRQAFAIVKAANAFVGVDSAFAHAATAFRTPAVVLFGASTPVIWGHGVNQNIFKAPRCSPCLDLLFSDPCPYGKLCMSSIAVSDVERALSLSITQKDV
jgi:ADP-heptose:LPS heptosyltransferase